MRKSGVEDGSRPHVPSWHRWAAAALAIAGIALLLLAREPLSEWLWPDTRVQQLRVDAARALQAGELTRADGRGARELYEAALALDPDRPDARGGLARVGRAALAEAEAAFARGDQARARQRLQLAQDLDVPRAQTDALADRLRGRAGSAAGIDLLLAIARVARATGRLDGGPDTALPLYQRILELRPNHTIALEGREDVLAELLQDAEEAVRRNDLARAAELVARVQAVDSGHVGLPAARATLAGHSRETLQQADRDLAADRLSQARDGYRAAADLDPGNTDAARGIVRVANAYAARSERHAADFRFLQAQAALIEAQALAADARAVTAAQQYMARARQSQARLASKVPLAQRAQRVRELLAAAAAAEARGDLLTPPGASAYDKLRAASAIAPQDPAVAAMSERLLPAARDCFEQALRDNRLTSAGACLDTWRLLDSRNLDNDERAIRDAQRRLALRWIAVGDERLGAGDLPAAQHALDSARALDPTVDGLDAFAERVRTAAVMVE